MTKKYANIYISIISAVVLVTAILLSVLPKSKFSEREKRALTEMPKISYRNFSDGTFLRDIDTYLCDHFPLRDRLVELNAFTDLALMRHSVTRDVYVGSDGYLFTAPTDRTKSNYVASNISFIKDFADRNDLSVSVMLVPNAGYILSDKLPQNHREYYDDLVLNKVKSTWPDGYIDLCNAFKEEKRQIYYKTDHHYTTLGAYTAYREFALSKNFEPLKESDFTVSRYDDFYGTSYAKAAFWNLSPDEIELWKRDIPDLKISIFDGGKESESDDFYFYDKLEGDDKYSVFLNENHGKVVIENPNAEGGSLLILKDSFANCTVPFISSHYKTVVMIDMRYYSGVVSEEVKKYDLSELLVLYGVDTFVGDKNSVKLK